MAHLWSTTVRQTSVSRGRVNTAVLILFTIHHCETVEHTVYVPLGLDLSKQKVYTVYSSVNYVLAGHIHDLRTFPYP